MPSAYVGTTTQLRFGHLNCGKKHAEHDVQLASTAARQLSGHMSGVCAHLGADHDADALGAALPEHKARVERHELGALQEPVCVWGGSGHIMSSF